MKLEEIYMRDPCVLVEDGTYYLIGSTDRHWSGGKSDGIKIYASTDLMEFSDPVTVFEPNPDFGSEECWWAPELHKYRGKYYIFGTFYYDKKAVRASQILVSDHPTAPFRPLTESFMTPPEWDCLDATLHVEDGTPYVVYCREWTRIRNGEIYAQRLSADLKEVLSEPILLFDAKSAGWTRGLNHHDPCVFDGFVTDGPYLHRMESGKLMMIWSSFAESGYAVGMSVSDNGSIAGPWRHLDELLFEGEGGHGMIFKDLEGNLRLGLHVNNNRPGKEHPVFYRIEEVQDRLRIRF